MAFFCTGGPGSNGHTFEDVEELCKKKPLAQLELGETEVLYGRYVGEVEKLLEQISERMTVSSLKTAQAP